MNRPVDDDSQGKSVKRGRRRTCTAVMISEIGSWFNPGRKNGGREFLSAQAKVAVVLAAAYVGNVFEPSYKRNENHSPGTFWIVNFLLAIAAVATWKHVEPRSDGSGRVIMLGRGQTEEWKGWMQWAFIFYHYYRVFYVYNEIRVFVSAYVWMTGFGNFLYFDKKGDYSIERFVSMILRINYFPLMLSFFLSVKLELYYVVPLHTTGFVTTMITCYVGHTIERKFGFSYWKARTYAVALSLLAHVLFYETPAVNFLLFFSKEIHFRFQADKYSAWMGIASGLLWGKVGDYMQWAHGSESNPKRRRYATLGQIWGGVTLIWIWYYFFGSISDKFVYNPVHPYVFILPVIGWLLIRNSTKYLTECHSTVLEYLGRNTLETYVLQFHLFMSHNVQHIPVVIPGADADGPAALKFLNMLVCGSFFLAMAVWARKITVTTQMTVVDLVKSLNAPPPPAEEEVVELVDPEGGANASNANVNATATDVPGNSAGEMKSRPGKTLEP